MAPNKVDKERSIAFVVARMTSSRLPGKHFRMIGKKPLIQWITDQLRKCIQLDDIIITTVAEGANEPLRNFARKEKLPCFWYEGDVDHVTTRLRKAAETYNADICILISGDCPLVYAPAIDQLIQCLKDEPEADIVRIAHNENGLSAGLEGVCVARKRAWQLADDLSDRPEFKEHQFPVIGMHPELFTAKNCILPKNLYSLSHRFSIDTQSDLDFMNTIYHELSDKSLVFELPEALILLNQRPDIYSINRHVHQRKVDEIIKKVLFITDATSTCRHLDLSCCTDLASQIIEHLSWPLTFMTQNQCTENLLKELGFPVVSIDTGQASLHISKQTAANITSEYDLVLIDIRSNSDSIAEWINFCNKHKPVFFFGDTLADSYKKYIGSSKNIKPYYDFKKPMLINGLKPLIRYAESIKATLKP
ncbi:MAG: NTP transferase domain-containing protein [Desulfobacterales bacterium]|nr:NTP transferase domain-containing protein [Desulfobacterales bacterium]